MGEFFPTENTENVPEKIVKIEDPNELFMKFNIEVEKINEVNRQAANTVLPDRTFLFGIKSGRESRPGRIEIIRDKMDKEFRMIKATEIGMEFEHVLTVIERLTMNENNYEDLLVKSMTNLISISKNAFDIIKNYYKQIEEKNKILDEVKQKAIHYTQAENYPEIKKVEPMPASRIIEPVRRIEPMRKESISSPVGEGGISEERKRELETAYNNCQSLIQFLHIINYKIGGKKYNEQERAYIKEFNKKIQKFKTKGV